jgi:hypothetical protein
MLLLLLVVSITFSSIQEPCQALKPAVGNAADAPCLALLGASRQWLPFKFSSFTWGRKEW